MKLLLVYLFIVNALSFALMLADKHKAMKNLWRIPEKILMWVAAIGGSFGSLLGMQVARHKTKHLKFTLGIPFIMAVQIIILILLFSNYGFQ